jgi:hypothetical protein
MLCLPRFTQTQGITSRRNCIPEYYSKRRVFIANNLSIAERKHCLSRNVIIQARVLYCDSSYSVLFYHST